MHLLGETIQDITITAWPIVWDGNKYDQDSRVILEMLRDWAEEFQSMWDGLSQDERDKKSYLERVEDYAWEKSQAYVANLIECAVINQFGPEGLDALRAHIEREYVGQ